MKRTTTYGGTNPNVDNRPHCDMVRYRAVQSMDLWELIIYNIYVQAIRDYSNSKEGSQWFNDAKWFFETNPYELGADTNTALYLHAQELRKEKLHNGKSKIRGKQPAIRH